MDERLLFDRFHFAFDVEPRPGMRERIRAALLSSDAGRTGNISSNATSSSTLDRRATRRFRAPSLQWSLGLVAVLVAAALIASLLYARGVSNRSVPAQPGPASPPACLAAPTPGPEVPFSSIDLQAFTGLSDPGFLTPYDLPATIGTQKITLIRAYADPLVTDLIFQVDPADDRMWILDLMHDDQGEKIPGGTGQTIDAGHFNALVFTMPGPKGYGRDGVAHLDITLGLRSATPAAQPSGPPEYVEDLAAGQAGLKFSLCVHPATSLPIPPAFHLGSGTVTIRSLEITPAFFAVQAVLDGVDDPQTWQSGNLGLYRVDPPCPSLPDGNVRDTTCLIDFRGAQITPLNGKAYTVDFGVLRPPAGNYRLVFRTNGATHGVPLRIPALQAP